VTASCTSVPVAADLPLVLIQTPQGVRIESFANPARPKYLCLLSPNVSDVRFISRTEIGYAISSSPDSPSLGLTEFGRMSLVDKRTVSVVTVKGGVVDFEWSPDGSNLAYLVRTESPGYGGRFWLKAGATAPLALTPVIPVAGREYISTDEMMVGFSHDSKFLVIVDTTLIPLYFQVRSVPGGKVVWDPPEPSTGPLTMAAWLHSSDRLYYQSSGVRTWDAGTNVVKVVAGLNWSSPSVSPDDRLVAYAADGSDGKPHLEVRDLASGSVRILPGVRGLPILLSNNLMIEGHFVQNVNGAPGPGYYLGHYYALNLLTNVETVLSGPPLDVWTR
jgi:hypothetical protein